MQPKDSSQPDPQPDNSQQAGQEQTESEQKNAPASEGASQDEKPMPTKQTVSLVQGVGMARLVSLGVILTAIIILGISFIRVLYPFILPLFLAGVTAILCQPMYQRYLSRSKKSPYWAAGLTTSSIVAMILIPMLIMVFIGGLQLYTFIKTDLAEVQWEKNIQVLKEKYSYRTIAEKLHQIAPQIQIDPSWSEEEKAKQVEIDISSRETQLRDGLRTSLTGILKQTFSPNTAMGTFGLIGQLGTIAMALVIYIFALYYFLADGPQLISATEAMIPVKVKHFRQVIDEFSKAVRAVVLATMMAALAQGFATSIALYFFGFNHFFLYSILAVLCALIPFVGTTIVWFPCVIWLAVQGHYTAAVLLFLYGSLVVGTMDNLIRAYVLNSDAKLHPLLAFVAILGGLQVMGLWGVFIAPIIASCLHALIKIFNNELREISSEATAIIQPPTIEA